METYSNDTAKTEVCVEIVRCLGYEHELMNIINTFVELIDKDKMTSYHRALLHRALEIHMEFVDCRNKLYEEFTEPEEES